MPEPISMTLILPLFYIVFIAQIVFLSIYIPAKMVKRGTYVLDNYPPSDYPKLYAGADADWVVDAAKSRMRIFRGVNFAIASIGFFILLRMLLAGYEPALKGGDEIFVFAYFMLQALPIAYLELAEFRHYRRLQQQYDESRRTADLTRRTLSDFVSPFWVVLAVALYVAWLVMFAWFSGPVVSWEADTIFVIALITAMNIAYGFLIRHHLHGKKQNPYTAQGDQRKQIATMIKVLVFSSIGISLFMILTQSADEFAFEVFDPVFASLYMQLCAAFGIGFSFSNLKVEDLNFEVYRDQTVIKSS